jgi:hypothetical protein
MPSIQFININTIVSILLGILGLFALLAVGYFIALFYIRHLREALLKQKSLGLVFFEVRVPQNNDVEIKAAEQMFAGLIGIGEKLSGFKKFVGARTFVSFEIIAFRESIKFYVICSKKIANLVDRQINGTYPMAEILKSKEYNLFPDDGFVSYAALQLDKDNRVPIQTYEELPVDTIATITDAFSKLQEGEAAAFQLVISPAGAEWRAKAKDYVKKMREQPKDEDKKSKPVDEEAISMIDRKVQKSAFHADVRILVISDDKYSAESHLSNILSSFDPFTKEGGNRFKKIKSDRLKTISTDFIYRIPRQSMILNVAELATLFHFPNKNIQTPYIKWLLARRAPAADFVTSTFQKDYMYIGKNTYRGQYKEVFIKPEDRLRHFYVVGQTGTGKSGFMSGMMIRDMKMGHGCGYIDPHGTDVEKILQQIPPERVEDVVLFDPADLERPVGLNMLEFKTDAQRTLAINEMLNIFDTLYNLKLTGGPMFEQYFRYAIMLVTTDPESGSTLMEIPKVFADEGYRAYKLSKCKDQEVIDFWKKQAEAAGGEASLKNVTPYVTSKLASFLSNAYVRPIIAQQQTTVNFREIMDDGKILLAKLSKGKIGDFNANLLGMILIGKLLISALERESTPESERRPFYLYIDEFQNFLTDGIMVILSEARKYKLALTMGHQFIGQLTREGNNTKIRDAVFGNVGNKGIFRVGEEDGPYLKKVVEGVFDENDLQQVENLNFFLKMLVDGKPTPPFSVKSIYGESPYDMIGTPSAELADIVRQISRLKYGKDRNIIENEIKLRGTFVKEKEDDGKNKNSLFGGLGGF